MSDPTHATDGIAIIGLAGRFPGADSVSEFWQNLTNGIESISHFSAESLAAAGISASTIEDESYIRARGTLSDIANFDAAFFGISPKEAELMDPQHRLMLETAWQSLEDAGYDAEQYDGMIGVYAGMSRNTYFLNNLHPNRHTMPLIDTFPAEMGNEKDYLTTRISYKLQLTGPSVNVSTACSTSLVATYHACESLLNLQCDMVLAGGVSAKTPQTSGYLYEEGSIGSPDGSCRPYDDNAKGTVFGNGVGMVVLKRLEDAIEDGDNIYAVIRGIAINNDGANKVSFGAPSVDGQAEVIAMAHSLADVSAETITYVEGHGTATPLGDPIEVAALSQAFAETTDQKQYCGLGSVKSNIGHLDAASGVAGLIKTTLALQNKVIPPTLHFEKPNAKIGLENTPFVIVDKLREWETGDTPRRAGVSAFGTGGTNAHAVLEEAPVPEPSSASREQQLLVLSAKTETALAQKKQDLAAHLSANPDLNLADVANTLQQGRKRMGQRFATVVDSAENAIDALTAAKSGYTRGDDHRNRPIVFMFPGQGSQYVNMGRDLYDSEPIFQSAIDRCATILQPHLNRDLRTIIYPEAADHDHAKEQLRATSLAQPAIFTVSWALAQLWQSWGIAPSAMIGHSVGEFVAATMAGVFTLEDALRLLAKRGELMQSLPGGSMLAVSMPEETLKPLLNGSLSIAAINAPNKCVVSGQDEKVAALMTRLEQEEIASRELHTSHAFHSPMMDPILDDFTQVAQSIQLNAPEIPFVSSTTGEWISAENATSPAYWARHLRETVRFASGRATLAENPDYVLLEVGPGNTLMTLSRFGSKQPTFHSLGHPSAEGSAQQHMLTALGQLWATGAQVDWPAFYENETRHRLPLPTYPFERKRFWIDPPASESVKAVPMQAAPAPTVAAVSNRADEAPMPQMQPQMPEPIPGRHEQIMAGIHNVLFELGGLEPNDIDPAATLIELGFDSLFITQASIALKKQFGVKVTFRQLMEDTPTPSALANFLDAQLPADAFADQVVRESGGQVVSGQRSAVSQQIATGGSDEALLQRLLAAFEREKAGLGDASNGGNFPANWTQTVHKSKEKPADKKESKKFGPWKPYQKSDDIQTLTPAQQTALRDLIDRYTAQTAGSKRLTERHRDHLADPRTASGFRALWKEMVYPIVSERSSGSKLWDVDGNEYIDIQSGFGSVMFGHSPDFVTRAVQRQLEQGVQIGPQHPLVGETTKAICELTGMDRATFCNTGSEAVMAAMRIARTVSGRDLIVTFAHDYHGQFDEVLVRGVTRRGEPKSLPIAPGIPRNAVDNMLVLEYGDPAALEIITERKDEIAAVMVESVQSRRPSFQPRQFLQQLRAWTKSNDVAFILDEVITGFRLTQKGAQGWYDIDADLVTYGKVIGGGMPIGILAGRRRYMDALDGGSWQFGDDSFPEVGVTYFAGTFVRHPLVVAGAHAVVQHLKANPNLQSDLNAKADRFVKTINGLFKRVGAPLFLESCGSMLHFKHFDEYDFTSLFYNNLRLNGVFLMAQRGFFLTTAHSEADLQKVTDVIEQSCRFMLSAEFWPTLSDNEWQRTVIGFDPSMLPITPEQQEIWLASQMSETASCAYNEGFSLQLDGDLDYSLLNEAIATVTARHQALWLQFSADGLSQQITAPQPLNITLDDFSQLSESERTSALDAAIATEASTAFDLAAAPLIRMSLFKLSGDQHLLYIVAHHIMFDGWSSGILVSELRTAYAALHAGQPVELGDPDSWRDYVDEVSDPADQEKALAYWTQQFATVPEALQLPGDRPRPAKKSYQGASLHWRFDPTVVAAVRATAQREGSSFFMMMMTAYQVLLHRLSGQTDFNVAIALAGQLNAGMMDLMGYAVKTLPLRVQLASDMTFNDYLAQAKQTFFDAQENQAAAIGTIAQRLNLPHDTSRTPLVDVIFNLDRADDGDGAFANLKSAVRVAPKTAINCDTFLNLTETEETLLANFEYSTDLFDEATLIRWLEHYQTLLGAFAANPQQPIGTAPLLPDAEKQRMLVEWNDTSVPLPEATVPQLFDAQSAETPSAVALIAGDEKLTFAELQQKANQLANYLIARGVQPGDPVGIALPRSFDMIVALLGTLKAGGVYLTMDPSYPKERLALMLEDAKATAVLTHDSLVSSLPGQDEVNLIAIDRDQAQIAEQSDVAPAITSTPDSAMYITYTSGSTGRPKGVIGHHRGVINRCQWQWNSYPFAEGETTVQKTTLNFVDSLWEIWGPLLAGVPAVLIPDEVVKDTNRLIDLLASHAIQRIVLVPSMIRVLLENYPDLQSRLPKLKYWTFSGEAVSRELAALFASVMPDAVLLNFYGMSEATLDASYYDGRWGVDAAAVPIGRPIENMQVYVLDANLQPLPVGVPGELYIGGVGLAQGYVGRADLTAERFISHPFNDDSNAKLYRSGDLARWLPEGQLEYLGRTDHQVKIRGQRIELGEIEATVRSHPQVREALVVVRSEGGSHATLDQQVVAYVIGDATTASLRRYVRARLPAAMVPSAFVTIDAFPLTPNGKVNRLALPGINSAEISPTTQPALTAPRNHLEQQMTQLWQKALKVRQVGIHDDFFELGGHSLTAMSILPQLSDIAGQQLPLTVLFKAPTIAQLAEIIGHSDRDPEWTSLVPLKPEGTKAPLFYVTAYLESLLAYTHLTRHFDDERPLYGIQAQGLDDHQPIHDSLPEMAAHYIREIKTVQPEGPYHITGHCAGGWVAFEMACQLQDAGEQVAFLGVVDSPPPHTYPPKTSAVSSTAERLGYYIRERRLWHAIAWQYQLKVQSRYTYSMGNGMAKQVAKVRRQYDAAMLAYLNRLDGGDVRHFQGKLHMFRSSEFAAFEQKGWHLRWGELASEGLAVHVIDSTHATLLHEPQVQALARQVGDGVDSAEKTADLTALTV